MNRKPRKSVLVAAVFCALGFGARGGEQKLEFEVASIKPTGLNQDLMHDYSRSGSLRLGARITGKRAEYLYMSLRRLVAAAYTVEPFQIVCPDWLLNERFDVVGVMPEGSRKEDAPIMLRALLVERFRLAVHRETRQEAVTALVVAGGGPKLKEAISEEQGNAEPSSTAKAEFSKASARGTHAKFYSMGTVDFFLTADADNRTVHVRASKMTMTELAHLLTLEDVSDHPVVDMTGLKGSYDIALDIPVTPAEQAGSPGAEVASVPGTGGILSTLKSLGLELKKMKAPVEYIVVDHADKRPSEN